MWIKASKLQYKDEFICIGRKCKVLYIWRDGTITAIADDGYRVDVDSVKEVELIDGIYDLEKLVEECKPS